MFCGSDFFSGGAELFLAFFFTVLDFFLGFVPGVIATTNLSYRIPIFETSATASCGSTGNMPEGILEVKLPTIWTDEKQSREGSERRERLEERRVEEKESEERRCRCAKR